MTALFVLDAPGLAQSEIDALDRLGATPSPDAMVEWLRDPALGRLRTATCYSSDRYTRTILHKTPRYQVVLVGWGPDQGSAIHDHRGVTCAFRVLQGRLTEETFVPVDDEEAMLDATLDLPAGALRSSRPECIHRLANDTGRPASSLHVYAPPLPAMKEYRRRSPVSPRR